MSKPSIQLATIDSGFELLVHLDQLDSKLTVAELAEFLALTAQDILDALPLERNDTFVAALYVELFELWGGELRPVSSVSTPPPIPLPVPGSELSHGQMLELLRLGIEQGHIAPSAWVLPREPLVVPFNRTHFLQLQQRFELGPSRHGFLELESITQTDSILGTLESAVSDLEAEFEARQAKKDKHLEAVALTRKIVFVSYLQERFWHAAGVKDPRKLAIAGVGEAAQNLLEATLEHLASPPSLGAASTRLMALLDPDASTPDAIELRALIELVGRRPMSVHAETRSRLLDLLERAAFNLSRSPDADRYLQQHQLDALEALLAIDLPGLEEALLEAEDPALVEEVRTHWPEPIEAARDGKSRSPSPLRHLARIATGSKTAVSVIAAGLSEMTIGTFLGRVHDVAVKGRPRAIRSMAGGLLRFVAYSCVQHRPEVVKFFRAPGLSAAEALKLTKGATYSAVIKLLGTKPPIDPAALQAFRQNQAAKLTELKLGQGFMRTRGGIGIMFALNGVLLLHAWSDDSTEPEVRALGVATAMGGLAQTLTRAAELLRVPWLTTFDDPILKGLQRSGKVLGGVFGALSLLSAYLVLEQTWSDSKSAPLLLRDGINFVGSAVTTASWCLEIVGVTSLAGVLGFVGLGIGIVGFAVSVAIDVSTPGVEAAIEGAMERIEQDAVVASRFREMKALNAALDKARDQDAFGINRQLVGDVRDQVSASPPTYHSALKLGFSADEIVQLFDSTHVHVRASLVAFLPPED